MGTGDADVSGLTGGGGGILGSLGDVFGGLGGLFGGGGDNSGGGDFSPDLSRGFSRSMGWDSGPRLSGAAEMEGRLHGAGSSAFSGGFGFGGGDGGGPGSYAGSGGSNPFSGGLSRAGMDQPERRSPAPSLLGASERERIRSGILRGFEHSTRTLSRFTDNVRSYLSGEYDYSYDEDELYGAGWQVRPGYPRDMESLGQLSELEGLAYRKGGAPEPESSAPWAAPVVSYAVSTLLGSNPVGWGVSTFAGLVTDALTTRPHAVGVFSPSVRAAYEESMGSPYGGGNVYNQWDWTFPSQEEETKQTDSVR
ncbi:MAG: hypothetical protein ACLFOY_17340, partial [Desulfatibacillaceae bacterium]